MDSGDEDDDEDNINLEDVADVVGDDDEDSDEDSDEDEDEEVVVDDEANKISETRKLPPHDIELPEKRKGFVPMEKRKPPPLDSIVPPLKTVVTGAGLTNGTQQNDVMPLYTNTGPVEVGRYMFIEDKPVDSLCDSLLVLKLQKVVNEQIFPSMKFFQEESELDSVVGFVLFLIGYDTRSEKHRFE